MKSKYFLNQKKSRMRRKLPFAKTVDVQFLTLYEL